ncbi:MAG: PhoH family protein [Leptospirales bacterium]|nr:PhoH family protein [Leptospirales bacterium]
MIEKKVAFESRELFEHLCGVRDQNIARLEEMLSVRLIPRGKSMLVHADNAELAERAVGYLEHVGERFSDPGRIKNLEEGELLQLLHSEAAEPPSSNGDVSMDFKIFTNFRGKPIYPRTARQAEFVSSILSRPVTISLGPAGTGKTFLSIVSACRLLMSGAVERIVLTRPAVEAGESLGFLPGDMAQKVDPYLRPVLDALNECLGTERVNEMIASRKIEIAPLAFMRGRTLSHSCVVLDEAQNCTLLQLKMFLTRLGRESRMCLSGDVTQIDLPPGKSGLAKAIEILSGMDGIGLVEFGREDIVRHPMVAKIVAAFDRAQKE